MSGSKLDAGRFSRQRKQCVGGFRAREQRTGEKMKEGKRGPGKWTRDHNKPRRPSKELIRHPTGREEPLKKFRQEGR